MLSEKWSGRIKIVEDHSYILLFTGLVNCVLKCEWSAIIRDPIFMQSARMHATFP
jgi:hypothetical protein